MRDIVKLAGVKKLTREEEKEGAKIIKKAYLQIIARGLDMEECECCGIFTYVNDEKECLSCQKKKVNNGQRFWKKSNLEEKTKDLESLRLKMQEIIGKLK